MGLFSYTDSDSPEIIWDHLKNKNGPRFSRRAKIPGGWLFSTQEGNDGGGGVAFIPDPNHEWDGSSLD